VNFFYDDIVDVLQSTIDSRIKLDTHICVYCKPEETITTVKRNLKDKLKVSNAEIHFTRECVNLVTHTNFTAL